MNLSGLQIAVVTLIAVLSVIGVALFARTVGHLVRVIRIGQPDPTRGGQAGARAYSLSRSPSGTRGSASGRWSGSCTGSSSSASGRCSSPWSRRTGSSSTRRSRCRSSGTGVVYEWLTELIAVAHPARDRRADRDPAEEPPSPVGGRGRPPLAVLRLDVLAGLLRRGDDPRGRGLRAASARAGVRTRPGGGESGTGSAGELSPPSAWHFPLDRLARRPLLRRLGRRAGDGDRPRRRCQDHRVDGLVHHDRPPADDGRGLAPVPRVPEHLVQAAPGPRPRARPHPVPRPAAADHGRAATRSTSSRSTSSTRTTPLGVGKVEDFTWKGLLDFTTCTECGRCQSQCPAWNTDKPLSPKLLVLTCATTRTARRPWLLAAEVPAGEAGRDARRRGDEAQAGRPLVAPVDPENPLARRRHRPGRPVVVHDVRRVRRAVPGRHRARRPHRRHAPLPGAHRVGVPDRARRPVQEPGEERQPVGR